MSGREQDPDSAGLEEAGPEEAASAQGGGPQEAPAEEGARTLPSGSERSGSERSRPPRRPALRRIAVTALLWLVGLSLATPVIALYFVTTPFGRSVVREQLNTRVSEAIRGRLAIGTIARIALLRGEVEAKAVSVFDADGEEVITADTVRLNFDYYALLRGEVRFESAVLHTCSLWLRDPDGDKTPSFVEALQGQDDSPENPATDDASPAQVVVDGIQLRDVTVTGELLGLQGIVVENASVDGRLEIGDPLVLSFENAKGTMVAPYPFSGELAVADGSFSDDETVGLSLRAQGAVLREGATPDAVEATVAFRAQHAGEQEELELTIRVDPADAALLQALGFSWAKLFRGTVRGTFRLKGPPAALSLQVDAETMGGPIEVRGTLRDEGPATLYLETTDLALASVIDGAPPINLTATGTLNIPAEGSPEAYPRFTIESEAFSLGQLAVPGLSARGAILDEEVSLDALQTTVAGGALDAAGRVAFDGRAWLAVKGTVPEVSRDPNVRRLVPGLRGGLALDITLQTPPVRGSLRGLRIAGIVNWNDFHLGPFSARTLGLEGSLAGDPKRPTLDLSAHGTAVRMMGQVLGDTRVSIRGTPQGYASELTATYRDRRAHVVATVVTPEVGTFHIPEGDVTLGFSEVIWRGRMQNAWVTQGGIVDVESLLMSYRQSSFRLAGRFGPSQEGRSMEEHLEAQLHAVDLGNLQRLLGERNPTLHGTMDGRMFADGDVTDPMFEIEGSLRDGRIAALSDLSGRISAGYGQGRFDVSGQLQLGSHGSLAVTGDGYIDTTADDVLNAFWQAIYENTQLTANDLDLAALAVLLREESLVGTTVAERLAEDQTQEVNGHVSGQVTFNGPLQAPVLSGALVTPDVVFEGWPALQASTSFNYEYGSLVVELEVADDEGPLISGGGSLVIDLYQLLVAPKMVVATLETQPWTLAVEAPERELASWPGPLRSALPDMVDPLTVALRGSASGGAFRTRVDLEAKGRWSEDISRLLCGNDAPPTYETTLVIRDDEASLEGALALGDETVLQVDASAITPVDDWLRAAVVPAMPEVDLSIRVPDGSVQRFAGLCDVSEGSLQGELLAAGLFGPSPRFGLSVQGSALRIAGAPPADASWSAEIDEERAYIESHLTWEGGAAASLIVQLPVHWGNEQTVPELADTGPLRLEGRFQNAPLAAFVGWLPVFAGGAGGGAGGILDGSFAVLGNQESPRFSGAVRVRDGYFELASVGQHLSGVQADVRLENGRAVLERLVARDVGGRAEASGEVRFVGLFPEHVSLNLEADRFPARREGSILANLTGKANLEAQITLEQTDVIVTLERVLAQLPSAQTRTVQALARHPDVHVVGEAPPAQENTAEAGYPILFHLDTMRPIMVRRSDFEAQVAANLVATVRGASLGLRGRAEVLGGNYRVFGKQFELDEGTMTFDRGDGLDPALNFTASHHIDSLDTNVVVRLERRLSDPLITFSSDHPTCVEREEIISMLISGACGAGGSTASDVREFERQTLGYLYGVGLGLGTFLIQEELAFLRFLDNLAFEESTYGPRVRAKLNLNFLIPNFLKDVIRSISVEGILTAPDEETQNQGLDHQVLPGGVIEAAFPYNFFVRFQFDPVGFAGDVNWEP